eukprot:gene16335-19431_t
MSQPSPIGHTRTPSNSGGTTTATTTPSQHFDLSTWERKSRISLEQTLTINNLSKSVQDKPLPSKNLGQFYDWFSLIEKTSVHLHQYEWFLETMVSYGEGTDELLGQVHSCESLVNSIQSDYSNLTKKTSQLHESCDKFFKEELRLRYIVQTIHDKLKYYLELETSTKKFNSSSYQVTDPSFVASLESLEDCIQFMRKNEPDSDFQISNIKFRSFAPKLRPICVELEKRAIGQYSQYLKDCQSTFFKNRKLILTPMITLKLQEISKQEDIPTMVQNICAYMVQIFENEFQIYADFFDYQSTNFGPNDPFAVIDAQLFLIKYFIILREQITPFDINFVIIEKIVDFPHLKHALSSLYNYGSLFAFSNQNPIYGIISSASPRVTNTSIDSKKDLEKELKMVIESFILSTSNNTIDQLLTLLTKISVFLNQSSRVNSDTVTSSLPQQPFAEPLRIKEIIKSVLEKVENYLPVVVNKMKAYLSPVTQNLLMKPIRTNIVDCFDKINQYAKKYYSEEQIKEMDIISLDSLKQLLDSAIPVQLSVKSPQPQSQPPPPQQQQTQ